MSAIGGRGLGEAILWSATPVAGTATAGATLESESKDGSVAKVSGKFFQMIPIVLGTCLAIKDEVSHQLFWHGISELKFDFNEDSPEAMAWWESVGMPEDREAFAAFWTPVIVSTICLAILATPFILKGLEKVARDYNLQGVANVLDLIEKAFMVAVKVCNVALIIPVIGASVSIASPYLVVVYSAFLAVNLYSSAKLVGNIVHKNLQALT